MKSLSRIALVTSVSFAALAGCGGTDSTSATSSEALTVFCDNACYGDISALEIATANATYTSRQADKDELGLIQKLDFAATKLCTSKPADAVQKLQDYLTQVQKLVCGGKIAPTFDASGAAIVTPDQLVAGATDAILCIDPLYVFPLFSCP